MPAVNIPAEVKDFIFRYIDSVEQLEILLLLFSDAQKWWSSTEVSDFLRSNKNSIEKRLELLIAQKLVVQDSESECSFHSADERLTKVIGALSEVYKIHKYRILEMIFSPMKKSRDFADAFRLTNPKEDKGDRNG